MRQQNFVVCESELTNFSAFDVESIVVVNAFFPFIDISFKVLGPDGLCVKRPSSPPHLPSLSCDGMDEGPVAI